MPILQKKKKYIHVIFFLILCILYAWPHLVNNAYQQNREINYISNRIILADAKKENKKTLLVELQANLLNLKEKSLSVQKENLIRLLNILHQHAKKKDPKTKSTLMGLGLYIGSSLIPSINKYFSFVAEENDYHIRCRLTDQGIRFLVDDSIKRGKLPVGSALIDADVFCKELHKLQATESTFQQLWVLYCHDDYKTNDHNKHVVSVLVRKLPGEKIKILYLESANFLRVSSIIQKIIENFPNFGEHFEFYFYKKRRQNDRVSCPFFCLKDLTEIFKIQKSWDIFEEIHLLNTDSSNSNADEVKTLVEGLKEENGVDLRGKSSFLKSLHIVDILPPSMMKPTQSWEDVLGPYQKNVKSKLHVHPRVKKQFHSLQKTLRKHTIVIRDPDTQKEKVFNNWISDRWYVCATKIIREIA